MFTGLSKEVCQQAWDMIYPSIAHAANHCITNKHAGTMVVARQARADNTFFFHVSVKGSDEKYLSIATQKAELSLRTGLPSSVVQHQYPYLYQEGDTKWGGSTVLPGGVVVAFSGVQAVYDEMFAEMMASAIKGLCRYEMVKPHGVMSHESAIIGVE